MSESVALAKRTKNSCEISKAYFDERKRVKFVMSAPIEPAGLLGNTFMIGHFTPLIILLSPK